MFLVHGSPGLVRVLDGIWLRSAVAIGILLAVVAAWRLLTATAGDRRTLAPVLAAGALVGGAEAAHDVALLRTPMEDPNMIEFAAIFFARAVAAGALALGIAWMVLRVRRVRAAVARVASAPPAGALRPALAAAAGDPTLDVAYWLPAVRRYVGADGQAFEINSAGDDRARTPILRAGQPVAVVLDSSALLDSSGSSATSAPPRGSPSRTSVSRLRCSLSSPTCAPRARESSTPTTQNAAGSSATSTTVRSSACSPSRTKCAWLARPASPTAMRS